MPTLHIANKCQPFSLQRLVYSKEHKTAFWIFILLVIFYLKSRLLVQHKDLNDNSWSLITIAVFLVLLDMAFEFNKKKFKKI